METLQPITAGLDYYKPTMSQLEFEQYPNAEVTFTFKNRGEQRLADYVNPVELGSRLEAVRQKGWTEEELEFLAQQTDEDQLPVFDEEFIDFLREGELPPVNISIDPETDDIAIETTGAWPLVTFWETIVMSEANELYFENFAAANGLDIEQLHAEGDKRLDEKITYFQANPDIKVAEFGTRRRFSWSWQRHVTERLQQECPDNFVGTSNVALAMKLGCRAIGTFAHELPMVYAGIADAEGEDIRDSHDEMLNDWYETYGANLSIALSDTFGSDFFFEGFGGLRAMEWRGTRHDSGDPIEYGEKTIDFYEQHNIDPNHKTVVFSDGLDIEKVDRIARTFRGRLGFMFGIGTDLTNDLGLEPLNIVMKATHVRLPDGQEADLVKLSDNAGKHTGPEEKIKEYQDVFFAHEKVGI